MSGSSFPRTRELRRKPDAAAGVGDQSMGADTIGSQRVLCAAGFNGYDLNTAVTGSNRPSVLSACPVYRLIRPAPPRGREDETRVSAAPTP